MRDVMSQSLCSSQGATLPAAGWGDDLPSCASTTSASRRAASACANTMTHAITPPTQATVTAVRHFRQTRCIGPP